jgi:hypothetical protein
MSFQNLEVSGYSVTQGHTFITSRLAPPETHYNPITNITISDFTILYFRGYSVTRTH